MAVRSYGVSSLVASSGRRVSVVAVLGATHAPPLLPSSITLTSQSLPPPQPLTLFVLVAWPLPFPPLPPFPAFFWLHRRLRGWWGWGWGGRPLFEPRLDHVCREGGGVWGQVVG